MPAPHDPVLDIAEARLVTLPSRPGRGALTMSVHEVGSDADPTLPVVVFSHGFPELGYSWRYQLPAVAAAGFRAIAPDQRGYGGTDAPEAIEAYDLGSLCGDLDLLCEQLGIERAVFVGHDWGGAVAWAMPALRPQRVAGIVGVCTPMMALPTTDLLESLVDGDIQRQYMLWFQEPGVAEAAMEPHIGDLFHKLMVGGIPPEEVLERLESTGKVDMNPFRDLAALESVGEPIVSDAEIDRYIETFRRTGLRGGVNWYRNMDRNVALYPSVARSDPGVPALMLAAEWDPALPPALSERMGDVIADLERHVIPRAGHWVQQEAPVEVNELLIGWLTRRFGG
ncbi:MAG: alpha/beta hydrolase [Microthrixaceae bacterium]|nr:alpha/beta hydrolase [Microthrixaceae bacterium]